MVVYRNKKYLNHVFTNQMAKQCLHFFLSKIQTGAKKLIRSNLIIPLYNIKYASILNKKSNYLYIFE